MAFTGNKYESGTDVKEVAKRVREDLKKAFPGAKFSVRISRFSMGCSLTVEAKSGNFPQIVELRPAGDLDQYGQDWNELRDARRELEDRIQGIVRAYCYRDVDTMTDYFNVSFYDHVDISDIREAQLAALRSERDNAPAVVISAEAIQAAAVEDDRPVVAAANVLTIKATGNAIQDARDLLHARVEAAIEAGDVKAARRLLDAVKALY